MVDKANRCFFHVTSSWIPRTGAQCVGVTCTLVDALRRAVHMRLNLKRTWKKNPREPKPNKRVNQHQHLQLFVTGRVCVLSVCTHASIVVGHLLRKLATKTRTQYWKINGFEKSNWNLGIFSTVLLVIRRVSVHQITYEESVIVTSDKAPSVVLYCIL